MRERILALEEASAPLEMDAGRRARLLAAAAAHGENWHASLPGLPGYVPDDEAGRAALARLPIGENPTPLADVLEVLAEAVDRLGVNEPAGHFFGFIPSGGSYPAAVGDYLAAVTNRYAGVFYGAPGAVRLERAVVEWIAGFLGYPPDAGGDLTSGGSLATLSAVVTAREAGDVAPGDVERMVVYLTEHTHHAVGKALRIAGLGDAVHRHVSLDDRYRMSAGHLAELVEDDRAAGLRPWLVVASAGTTDTGAIDPLPAIADLCAAEDLWLHVDAAYGGAFALIPEGKRALAGIERSDSLVFDPHKGLFLPFGTGVVLVKDRAAMLAAHAYSASYLQDTADAEVSPADVSAELTRPFRGLRVWLPLLLAGVAVYRAALEEKLLLARYFHERVGRIPGVEAGPPPDLSVVTFRIAGGDDPNRRFTAAVQTDGRIYLSSTVIDGRVTQRLAVLGHRTHLRHVDLALDVIGELAGSIRVPPAG